VDNGEYSLSYPESKMPGKLWHIHFQPDGEPICYYFYKNSETNGIIAKSMTSDEKKLILKSDHPIGDTMLSPDGKKLLYFMDNGMYMANTNDDEDLSTLILPIENSWPIGWSADGQTIYIKKSNEEKNGMEVWSLSLPDKILKQLLSSEQLQDFKYVRKINIREADHSTWLTMTMGSYIGEMWKMENLFNSKDLSKN
jgi:hypothetical protein